MPERKPATLAEIDALREEIGVALATGGEVAQSIIFGRLAKIRAHAEADELEAQRLRGELFMSVHVDGRRIHTEKQARDLLDLKPDWRLAPSKARRAAVLMPPVRICGEKWAGDESVICQREANHTGEHCPVEDGACGVDHG